MAHDHLPPSRTASAAEALRLSEQLKEVTKVFARIGAFDNWTCVVDVDGFLEGDFADWPANIQDGLAKAVELQCIPKPGEYVKIVVGKCYQDVPTEPPYLRVVAQAFPILVH